MNNEYYLYSLSSVGQVAFWTLNLPGSRFAKLYAVGEAEDLCSWTPLQRTCPLCGATRWGPQVNADLLFSIIRFQWVCYIPHAFQNTYRHNCCLEWFDPNTCIYRKRRFEFNSECCRPSFLVLSGSGSRFSFLPDSGSRCWAVSRQDLNWCVYYMTAWTPQHASACMQL